MHSVVEGYIWEQQNEQRLCTKECCVIGCFNIIVARYIPPARDGASMNEEPYQLHMLSHVEGGICIIDK